MPLGLDVRELAFLVQWMELTKSALNDPNQTYHLPFHEGNLYVTWRPNAEAVEEETKQEANGKTY